MYCGKKTLQLKGGRKFLDVNYKRTMGIQVWKQELKNYN